MINAMENVCTLDSVYATDDAIMMQLTPQNTTIPLTPEMGHTNRDFIFMIVFVKIIAMELRCICLDSLIYIKKTRLN